MPRNAKVGDVMTTDVLSFAPSDNVQTAMQAMVERGVDGAPVVDGDNRVVGVLSTGDLIVQESRLHLPTVISLFGAYLELPSSARHFDHDIEKALGADVVEVMHDKPITITADQTMQDAATAMHDHEVSRLPVVDDDGRLVGIVGRADILRIIIGGASSAGGGAPAGGGSPAAVTAPGAEATATEAQ